MYQFEQLAANATLQCLNCLAKQNVSFVLRSTKDIQEMLLGKLSFFAYIIPENEVQINKNNYEKQQFSCQNKSICQKVAQSCKKRKMAQKEIYGL